MANDANENMQGPPREKPLYDLYDWNAEDVYWRMHYATRPYVAADRGYNYYEPGYRYGAEAAARYRGRSWDEVEADLRQGWEAMAQRTTAAWEDITGAVRDAWDRLTGRGANAHTF